jgi:hypothetical protein
MQVGAIIWTGSAFDCTSTNNEIIIFLSSRFSTGNIETCNNGAIVGRSLSIEGNHYTSQLNVTITPDTAGTAIGCFHDNGSQVNHIYSLTIPTTTG